MTYARWKTLTREAQDAYLAATDRAWRHYLATIAAARNTGPMETDRAAITKATGQVVQS